jgi:hypothetical protein
MNSPDPLDIRAQEVAREEAQERNKLAGNIEEGDIKWLMANKRGRRIVYRLLERAGVWRLSFDTNALRMAFNEGNRNEGLALLAKLMAYCPEQYAVMLKEQEKNG